MSNEHLKQAQTEATNIAEKYKDKGTEELAALWLNTVYLIEVARRLPPPLDDTE